MKLAFSTLGCPDWDLARVIEAALTLGYQGVEIRGLRGCMDIRAMPELNEDLPATAARFRDAGLEVVCLALGATLGVPDRAQRRAQIELVRRGVVIAAALGCPYVRVFGGRIPPGASRDDCADDIAQALTALGGAAAPRGVTVLLETHDDYCLGQHAADVVDRVSGPGVGVLWDILHPYRCGEPLADTLNYLGSHIRHVHVKDAVGLGPAGFRPALLGEGDVPVRDALRLLLQTGYQGALSFEWEKAWHPGIPGPEVAFPHFIDQMRSILRSLSAPERTN